MTWEHQRVEELLAGVDGDGFTSQLVGQATLFADFSSIAEEAARLTSHCGQVRALLATGGPIGRQLDFLAQEMHREVNTVAAKADDAEMVARVLEARTVVERLREQDKLCMVELNPAFAAAMDSSVQ